MTAAGDEVGALAAPPPVDGPGRRARRWPWRVAIAIAVLAVAVLLGGAALAVLAESPSLAAGFAPFALIGAVTVGLGLLVGHRHPAHLVAPLLGAMGLCLIYASQFDVSRAALARHVEPGPLRDWIAALVRESGWWLPTSVALLLLYFPDGCLPSRRWRWVPPLVVAGGAANHAWGVVDPKPYPAPLEGVQPVLGEPSQAVVVASIVAFVVFAALNVACAASLVGRYRRSDAAQRAQVKWLALAGMGLPLTPLVAGLEVLAFGEASWLTTLVGTASIVALPAAVAVALLRHDLYDVDKAIVAAITYGTGTVALVLAYAAASYASGVVIGGSSALAAAATVVAAIGLAPLRTRLQGWLDRRLYPLRRAARVAVQELMERTHAGNAQPEELEDVLRRALRDPGLRVGFRLPGSRRLVDRGGASTEDPDSVPVNLGSVPIGVLVPGGGPASRELLRDVASWSATLVEVVRLRLELGEAVRDVAASRGRMLQAAYAERRRLERDLHDGAQQRLVSLGMSLRLAQRRMRKGGAVDPDALIDASVEALTAAVRDLRQIAHGLRPSSLDEGLGQALATLVKAVPIPATLDVRVDAVPDDVATTVYFVASEAIANALKHAHAERIGVRVTPADGHVHVRVEDDGRGGASVAAGSGLAGLTDRVAAMNGRLAVLSPAGGGTVVEATLPSS